MKLELRKTTIRGVLAVLISLGTLYVAGHLLYSAWCAFTWSKFKLFDYGVYTNMLWNTGHGSLFRVLVDSTYLSTHLSFSLGLLGLLYHVVDHPFLLSFVQWAMVVSGAVILWRMGHRAKVPADVMAAILFLFVGYRFTQGVVLSEFHTVGAYFLLVPWLYYCCVHKKRWAWLPLMLILGVREDAFIFVLPILLYFAIKDRWVTGYILFGAALAYGVLAIFVLYPKLAGMSLFDRRGSEIKASMDLSLVAGSELTRRGMSLIWTLLPALIFVHKRSVAPFVFPAAALATCLASGFPTQQGMGSHYGSPAIVCLGIGLMEAAILRTGTGDLSRLTRRDLTGRALGLVAVTIVLHLYSGFIAWGGKNLMVYNETSMAGKVALRAARHIPRDGVLITDNRLVGFCANRADVLTERRYRPQRHTYDLVFSAASGLPGKLNGEVWDLLQSGEMGIRYYDDAFVIAQRGYKTPSMTKLLDSMKYVPILIPLTPKHGGRDIQRRNRPPVRYWEGKGYRTPITLSYGGSRWLEPGTYDAVFRYRAAKPERVYKDTWGSLSVHVLNDQRSALATRDIFRVITPPGNQISQAVRFDVPFATNIEVRVTGGDAELWLNRVMFVPTDVSGEKP